MSSNEILKPSIKKQPSLRSEYKLCKNFEWTSIKGIYGCTLNGSISTNGNWNTFFIEIVNLLSENCNVSFLIQQKSADFHPESVKLANGFR